MVDKVNVELDKDFLTKFFALTDRVIPEDQEITLSILRRQLDEVKVTLADAQSAARDAKSSDKSSDKLPGPISASSSFFSDSEARDTFNLPKKNLLIIDDLGVITYQLSVLFKQFNLEVTTSKEIYDAIDKFKKQSFDIVIMDLFIPTEREGFILLEELRKIASSKQQNVKLGVMSASSKKEHRQLCKMKGAEFYVEKIDDWQKELFRVIRDLK